MIDGSRGLVQIETPWLSPKRRLLVIDDGMGLWGAQRCVLRLVPFLLAADYELTLAAPPGSELAQTWISSHIGDVIPLPEIECAARNALGNISLACLFRSTKRLIKRAIWLARVSVTADMSMVLANSYWTHFDSALASVLSGIPTTLYLHEEIEAGLPAVAVRAAIAVSSATIAVSRGVINGFILSIGAAIEFVHPKFNSNGNT